MKYGWAGGKNHANVHHINLIFYRIGQLFPVVVQIQSTLQDYLYVASS